MTTILASSGCTTNPFCVTGGGIAISLWGVGMGLVESPRTLRISRIFAASVVMPLARPQRGKKIKKHRHGGNLDAKGNLGESGKIGKELEDTS